MRRAVSCGSESGSRNKASAGHIGSWDEVTTERIGTMQLSIRHSIGACFTEMYCAKILGAIWNDLIFLLFLQRILNELPKFEFRKSILVV